MQPAKTVEISAIIRVFGEGALYIFLGFFVGGGLVGLEVTEVVIGFGGVVGVDGDGLLEKIDRLVYQPGAFGGGAVLKVKAASSNVQSLSFAFMQRLFERRH